MKIMVAITDGYNSHAGRIFTDVPHIDYTRMVVSSSPSASLYNMQQTSDVSIDGGDIIVEYGNWILQPLSDKNVHLIKRFYRGKSLEEVLRFVEEYRDAN